MTVRKLPSYVSTLWFEPGGAARYAACYVVVVHEDRVCLQNMQYGNIQANITLRMFRRLMTKGQIRPLDEVPTQPSMRRPKLL